MNTASDSAPLTATANAEGSTEAAPAREIAARPPAAATQTKGRTLISRLPFRRRRQWGRGLAFLDFFLRLSAIAALIAAAVAMGNADETLPFFTNAFQFHANFSDLPAFLLLVIGDAIAAGYLFLSIPLSIISIITPAAVCPRLFLLIFDLVAAALTMAVSSAAAAIVYLAHTGNSKANWIAICLRFKGFCQQSSGAVVASFVGAGLLLLMVVISTLILRRNVK